MEAVFAKLTTVSLFEVEDAIYGLGAQLGLQKLARGAAQVGRTDIAVLCAKHNERLIIDILEVAARTNNVDLARRVIDDATDGIALYDRFIGPVLDMVMDSDEALKMLGRLIMHYRC